MPARRATEGSDSARTARSPCRRAALASLVRGGLCVEEVRTLGNSIEGGGGFLSAVEAFVENEQPVGVPFPLSIFLRGPAIAGRAQGPGPVTRAASRR